MLDRYFDHAATTPLDRRALEIMLPFLREECGNANSLHGFGRRARSAVEDAREAIAGLLGADDPREIVFTSGATEANNWVVQKSSSVACSPFEHSSVLEPVLAVGGSVLASRGYDLEDGDFAMTSVIHVNNETGAILGPPNTHGPVHRDLTQSVGKVSLPDGPFDLASCSAHKLYGPKGIGVLWIRTPILDSPLLYGGEHEMGLRAGTLNVPGIVGFGEAARIAADRRQTDAEEVWNLRSIVLGELERIGDWRENRHIEQSPFILSLSFIGLEGQTLVEDLDVRGFAVSSGAACSSGSTDPSHVLTAIGLESEWIRGTIRVSFGRTNTRDSARELGRAIVESVGTARNLRNLT